MQVSTFVTHPLREYLASPAMRLQEAFSLSDFRTVPKQGSFHRGLRHLDEPIRPQLGYYVICYRR